MSEEIKEIVKDEDELIVFYKDNSFVTYDTLKVDVIDYITNLQQESQQLKSVLDEIRECAEQDCGMYEIIKILDKVKE